MATVNFEMQQAEVEKLISWPPQTIIAVSLPLAKQRRCKVRSPSTFLRPTGDICSAFEGQSR
jgi:hypothetical protein